MDISRKFVYDYAVKNNISIPPTWIKNEMAGYDWIYGYMRRMPELSLRKPENTSLARLEGFNKDAVLLVFKNLASLYERYHFSPKDVYNLDETGIQTVLSTPKVKYQQHNFIFVLL